MDHGILRVSETAKAEIEAARAFVMMTVTSEKLAFGNAAVTASEDLKVALAKIKQIDSNVSIETESVSTETNTGVFGKNSTATYTVKLTIGDIEKLGEILGICSEGKRLSVRSILWDYDEDEAKLQLIKQAVQKAKHKADQMMAVINYKVVGIRTCSDSYRTPTISEIVLSPAGALESSTLPGKMPMQRTRNAKPSPTVDIGTQFNCKKKIAATCTAEFVIQEST